MPEEAAIRERAAQCRATWEQREPAAVAALFVAFDKTLSSLHVKLAEALLPLRCTTNLLERLHREARRSTFTVTLPQRYASRTT